MKQKIIQAIAQRIKDEHDKHSHSIDTWNVIAATKIYSSFDIKIKKLTNHDKNKKI